MAISNHRIVSIDDEKDLVPFDYKDYADENAQKQMALDGSEFIRRFQQQILPKHFTKIRTYGYLANRNRQQRIYGVRLHLQLPLHKSAVVVHMDLHK